MSSDWSGFPHPAAVAGNEKLTTEIAELMFKLYAIDPTLPVHEIGLRHGYVQEVVSVTWSRLYDKYEIIEDDSKDVYYTLPPKTLARFDVAALRADAAQAQAVFAASRLAKAYTSLGLVVPSQLQPMSWVVTHANCEQVKPSQKALLHDLFAIRTWNPNSADHRSWSWRRYVPRPWVGVWFVGGAWQPKCECDTYIVVNHEDNSWYQLTLSDSLGMPRGGELTAFRTAAEIRKL